MNIYIYKDDDNLQLYILYTKELRNKFLSEHHDSPLASHLGFDDRHIKNYIENCDTCQRIKANTTKQNGLMYPHAIPPHPFHTISIDLITDLPESKRKNNRIFVMVCKLSKYTYMEPIKKTHTATDLPLIIFKTIVRRHGLPQKIISDRDIWFTAKLWQELFRIYGT